MVDAHSKYIQMVELNYLGVPLTGSNPVLTTKTNNLYDVRKFLESDHESKKDGATSSQSLRT